MVGGGVGALREGKETNVYKSATAHVPILTGKVQTGGHSKKIASCTPAKIVSYNNIAPVTPQPATFYLPRLPLIILNELMCTRDKYSLIRAKRKQHMSFLLRV